MSSTTGRPARIAFEGCGHGTLNAIYASVAESSKARGWDGVDLVIIGGDFQAVRNAADLTIMSCPAKYRAIGDFADYYAGRRRAPYLTVFIGGNHEASSHLNELFYGGWVAPGIYYLGAAGVVRLEGGLRVAGLSGIWKGHDYRKPHLERLPFTGDDVRSCYHVREVDVRRLLLLRSQVDVGLSHDWPRRVEMLGDHGRLFRCKPLFREDSIAGRLGSPAAEWVMDRLRPPYWFSAHMHCKFSAIKTYEASEGGASDVNKADGESRQQNATNPDEIGLDDDDDMARTPSTATATAAATKDANPDDIDLDDDELAISALAPAAFVVPEAAGIDGKEAAADKTTKEVRAQLPASFARPGQQASREPRPNPGQPAPPGVTNRQVRFLALDKCLPGRHYIQLMEIKPVKPTPVAAHSTSSYSYPLRLEYDPEWLAITRALSPLVLTRPGEGGDQTPQDKGEAVYAAIVDKARAWVEEHVVRKGKLAVPENFEMTAPAYVPGTAEAVPEQPVEWTNPQTAAFCEMLEIENLWDATEEEREERRAAGPPAGSLGGGGWGSPGRGGRGGGNRGGRGRR